MNEIRQYVVDSVSNFIDVKKADNIEKSLFNYTLHVCDEKLIAKNWENFVFEHIYKQHFIFIKDMILSNETLLNKIKSKEILTKDVAFLRLDDIKKMNSGKEIEDEEEVADGIFQCKKCGSKKTTYYSLQTRSADEPMTNFITCVECKNRWKM